MSRFRDPLRLGFLASHGGSNVQAIVDAIPQVDPWAEPRVVICNNSSAMALERARNAGIPAHHLSGRTHPDPDALDAAIAEVLTAHDADLVVLAGYMKKIGPRVLGAFPNRIVNIHPALLPRHGGEGMYGLRVHKAVLAAGDEFTGVTIHLVNAEYDRGPNLAQESIAVRDEDTPESLQARVLEIEHRIYAETLRRIAKGLLHLDGY